MDKQETAKLIGQDIDAILKQLDMFEKQQRKELTRLKEGPAGDPLAPLRYGLESLRTTLSEFARKPDTTLALQVVTALSFVSGQVEAISSRLDILAATQGGLKGGIQRAAAVVARAWNAVIPRIKSLIQSISASLWSLISRYLNLKEWSISGGISSQPLTSIFGITGSAEIQLTFGK